MAEQIRCPMCSRLNPAELEVCQFCEARLRPLIAGQPPAAPGSPSEPPAGPEGDETPDWLGSLRSKQDPSEPAWNSEEPAGDEATPGEVPDWLSRIREKNQVEGEEEPAAERSPSSDLPDWLRGVDQPAAPAPQEPDAPAAGLPDWLSADAGQPGGETASEPDWLGRLGDEPAAPPASAETAAAAESGPAFQAADADTPDWLRGFGQEESPAEPAQDAPDWFSSMDETSAASGVGLFNAPETPAGDEPALPAEDLPEWLGNLMDSGPAEPPAPAPAAPVFSEPAGTPAEDEVPDWMAQMGSQQVEPPAFEQPSAPLEPPDFSVPSAPAEPAAPAGDTPDWLAAFDQAGPGQPGEAEPAAPFGGDFSGWPLGSETSAVQPGEGEAEPLAPGEAPEWLAALAPGGTTPPADAASIPPLVFDDTPAGGTGQTAEPFVMDDLPDWLSAMGPASGAQVEPPSQPVQPAEGGETEGLIPAELPSWVQAMRPIESAAAAAPTGAVPQEVDNRLEKSGPLSGLRGVLPAEVAPAAYSKPAAYSVKLQPSEAQKRYSEFLDELLVNENVPAAPRSERILSTQRLLRAVIGVLLIAVVALGSFAPLLPLTNLVPQETLALRDAVQALPAGSPVLLVVDYEPALAGEMETAAAPLVNQLMERGSRLALVSTQPTGSLLAARLLENSVYSQAEQYHDPYITGQSLVDLGFVSGGPAGIAGLLSQPAQTAPGWRADHPALTGVSVVTDFSAVVLLTDSVDTGRGWFEQISAAGAQLPGLADVPVLLVSSAQAGPVLRPYLDSGQVRGMLTGLTGGALYEALLQRSGTANRHWDSFQAGLLVSLALILFGGLLNGGLGLFSRSKSKDEA